MKYIIPIVAIALAAFGCSSDNTDVENVIKQRLKDPESARFQSIAMNSAKNIACVTWNAKNSFGGYGESTLSSLRKTADSWQIDNLEVQDDYCTQQYLDALDELYRISERLIKLAHNSPGLIPTEFVEKTISLRDAEGMMSLETLLAINESLEVVIAEAKKLN